MRRRGNTKKSNAKNVIKFVTIGGAAVALSAGMALSLNPTGITVAKNLTAEVFKQGNNIYFNNTEDATTGTGTGEQATPYTNFKNALASAQDNDVLFLTENMVYRDVANAGESLKIDKNITIDGQGRTLSIRGVDLELLSNVKFKNITLVWERDGGRIPKIYASDNTVVFDNVSTLLNQGQSSERPILVTGAKAGSTSGTGANITFENTNAEMKFEKIIVGGENQTQPAKTTFNLPREVAVLSKQIDLIAPSSDVTVTGNGITNFVKSGQHAKVTLNQSNLTTLTAQVDELVLTGNSTIGVPEYFTGFDTLEVQQGSKVNLKELTGVTINRLKGPGTVEITASENALTLGATEARPNISIDLPDTVENVLNKKFLVFNTPTNNIVFEIPKADAMNVDILPSNDGYTLIESANEEEGLEPVLPEPADPEGPGENLDGAGDSQPAGPGAGAEQPAGPGAGAEQPAGPGAGEEQPAGPGAGEEQPAGPGADAEQPAGPGEGEGQPAAEPTYDVIHKYESSNPGKYPMPKELKDKAPAAQLDLMNDLVVSVDDTAYKADYRDENLKGVWRFVRWDKTEDTIRKADVIFTAVWEFTPDKAEDAAQPAPGGDAAQPAPGGDAAQPAPGGDAAQPAPGGDAGQPAPGGYAAQPAPGGDAGQPSEDNKEDKQTDKKSDSTTSEDLKVTEEKVSEKKEVKAEKRPSFLPKAGGIYENPLVKWVGASMALVAVSVVTLLKKKKGRH